MRFYIPSVVTIVPLFLTWLLATSTLHVLGRYRPSFTRHLFLTACVVYILAVIHVTLFPIRVITGSARDDAWFQNSIHIIPFMNIQPGDMVLNTIMTMPFGFLWPMVVCRWIGYQQMTILGFRISVSIELVQWILRETVANDRMVDIHDVVANVSGTLIGYAVLQFVWQSPMIRKLLGVVATDGALPEDHQPANLATAA